MKVVALCSIFLVVLVASIEAKRCDSDADCEGSHKGNRCCLGYQRDYGRCEKLHKEGWSCNPHPFKFNNTEVYVFDCPCDEGLECVFEEDSSFPGYICKPVDSE